MVNEQDDSEIVEQHMNALAEHYDSVQIFVTRYDASGTVSVALGTGNWFTRYGQTSEWLVKRQEEARKETDE